MADELTRDADQMLCILYKEYLTRCKAGHSKWDSKDFSAQFFHESKPFCGEPFDDVLDTMVEIHLAGYVEMDLGGNCFLKDKAIIYMENRFKNGLTEVLSVISQFIP